MKIKDFIGKEFDFLPHEHEQLPTTMSIKWRWDVVYHIKIEPKEFPKGIITDISRETVLIIHE